MSKKNAFHAVMAVLQSATLEPEAEAFIYGIISRALAVFSSIEHVVKENSQVISKFEEFRWKKNLSMSDPNYLLTRAFRD